MDEDQTRLLRPRRSTPPPLPLVSEPRVEGRDEADDPTRLMASPHRSPTPLPNDERTVLYRPKNLDPAPPITAPAASVAAAPAVGLPSHPVVGWLVIVKGPGRGHALALGYGTHSIGRGADQRLPIPFGDDGISRQNHVSVSYDGKGRRFYVAQGASSALAYLNGKPILQAHPLEGGDVIALGETELAFVPFCGEHFDWQEA